MKDNNIVISICCLTCNHEKYIRKCIDGFLMQQTDFKLEIIIHDDASSDGTKEIIEEYTTKYPEIFRPVFQAVNLYSSGTGIYQIYTDHALPLCKGKYIAICEGDDYWTDPLKLQKQVDFMEQNQDYSVCFHKAGFTSEKPTDFLEHEKYFSRLFSQTSDFVFEDLLRDNFIPNCTVVYRNIVKSYPPFFNDCTFPDWPLHLIYAKAGKIKFLNELMAIHFKHEEGLWEGESLENRNWGVINFYKGLLRFAESEFYPVILKALEKHSNSQTALNFQEAFDLGYSIGVSREEEKIESLQNQLNNIFSSLTWKFAVFFRHCIEFFLPPDSKRMKCLIAAYHFFLRTGILLKRIGRKVLCIFGLVDRLSKKFNKVIVLNTPWPKDLPLVSVIIPNYNYGRFIKEAITSVLDQTFNNFEIIIVDGGSNDPETISILKDIQHPKIQVHLRKGRHWVGDNRNYGISRAKGKYICCLDADDIIEPTYLEKALFFLETYHYDVVYPWVQSFGKSTTLWKTCTLSFEEMLTLGNPVATCAMFRKSCWEKAGGYKDWPVGKDHIPEDWDFWTRMAGHGFRFKRLPEALMLYRTHGESITDICGTTHEKQLEVIRTENKALNHKKYRKIRNRNNKINYLVSEPFKNLRQPKTKKRILLALPFMITGGVDTLFLNIFSNLARSFDISIITTLEEAKEFGDNTPQYQKITREIYKLSKFLSSKEEMIKFIHYLIEAKDIEALFMAGSEFTYNCLPALKSKNKHLKIIDFLFNETGHIVNNRKHSQLIDITIVENERIESLLKEKFNESSKKIELIHNGINVNNQLKNPDVKALRAKHNLSEQSFLAAFMGRFSEEKNPHAVIEIAKKVRGKEVEFFMGGNGPIYKDVVNLIKRNDLNHIIKAPGFVDTKEILAIADVVILPSIIDGRPNIVLEALAAGVPVIASDVGGLPTLIIEGYNGFLLKAKDYDGFADKIKYLQTNPNLLSRMKLNARTYAIENLDDKKMHKKYMTLLNQLLKRK